MGEMFSGKSNKQLDELLKTIYPSE